MQGELLGDEFEGDFGRALERPEVGLPGVHVAPPELRLLADHAQVELQVVHLEAHVGRRDALPCGVPADLEDRRSFTDAGARAEHVQSRPEPAAEVLFQLLPRKRHRLLDADLASDGARDRSRHVLADRRRPLVKLVSIVLRQRGRCGGGRLRGGLRVGRPADDEVQPESVADRDDGVLGRREPVDLHDEVDVGPEPVAPLFLAPVVEALEAVVDDRHALGLPAPRAHDLAARVVDPEPLGDRLRVHLVGLRERRLRVGLDRRHDARRRRLQLDAERLVDGRAPLRGGAHPDGARQLQDLLERHARRRLGRHDGGAPVRPLVDAGRALLLHRPARRQDALGVGELLVDRDLRRVEEVREPGEEAGHRPPRVVGRRNRVERDVDLPAVTAMQVRERRLAEVVGEVAPRALRDAHRPLHLVLGGRDGARPLDVEVDGEDEARGDVGVGRAAALRDVVPPSRRHVPGLDAGAQARWQDVDPVRDEPVGLLAERDGLLGPARVRRARLVERVLRVAADAERLELEDPLLGAHERELAAEVGSQALCLGEREPLLERQLARGWVHERRVGARL